MRLLVLLTLFSVLSSGCSQLMGSLRKDLDDRPPYEEPTVGGMFPEGGFLDEYEHQNPSQEDRYAAVGHSERGPASIRYDGDPARMRMMAERGYDGAYSEEGDEARPLTYTANPNVVPPTRREYREGMRAKAADFVDESQTEGSLWASNGQTNYFFTKNKVRSVGDIVTVVMGERLIKDVATELKKTLTQEELDQELFAAENKARADAMAAKGKGGARRPAAQGAPEEAADEEEEEQEIRLGYADVDLTPAMGIKEGESMMAEILERYPNGNYKIRATKRVPFRNSTRMVTLVAIARGQDVNNSETVESANLYEYRIKAYH